MKRNTTDPVRTLHDVLMQKDQSFPKKLQRHLDTSFPSEKQPPAGWRRSSKGNLYRIVGNVTTTIFKRWDELWTICIYDSEGTHYGSTYKSEQDALDAITEFDEQNAA